MVDNLKYCTRCWLPETSEKLTFDDMGICRACVSSEQKMRINWAEKEKELSKILSKAKKNANNNYDCVIPISGGKDSTFQLHILKKIYGLKPLAVTFNHNWLSRVGYYNLMNCLEEFSVDHIMFTPNRSLVNRMAKRSISLIGDSCWHCHSGIGSFALHIAQKFNIKLLIWGESIADSSGKASYKDEKYKFDRDYFLKTSAKVGPDKMACDSFNKDAISAKELAIFNPPSKEQISENNVVGIHLGDYIFWDDERHTEFVKKEYNWIEDNVERTYKQYKSVECVMEGVHSFMWYLKRGMSRVTTQASSDIRNGIMTREEALEIIKKYETQIPGSLKYYLDITDLNENEFYTILEKFKEDKIKDIKLPKQKNLYSFSKENNRPFIINFIEKIRNEFKRKK